MVKTLEIATNKDRFFRQYIELINPFLQLTSTEADVFALLLKMIHEKRNMPLADAFDIVFTTKNRKKIGEIIGIPQTTLRNIFTSLRKKNLIVNNTIPENYLLPIEDTCVLQFNFVILE